MTGARTTEARLGFPGKGRGRDSLPPLQKRRERELLTKLLAKAEGDAAAAADRVDRIDASLSENSYLLDLFTALSEQTGVDYALECDSHRKRIDELETSRDECLGIIERAKVLGAVLTEQLATEGGSGVLAKLSAGRTSYRRHGRLDGYDDLLGGALGEPYSPEEVVVVGPGRRGRSSASWSRRLLIVSVVLMVVAVAVAAYVGLRGDQDAGGDSRTAKTGSAVKKIDYSLIGKHGIVDIIALKGRTPGMPALGYGLDKDYADRSRVQVYVFDDRSGAEYLDKTYDLDISKLSQDQLAAEYDKYYPHWVATYFRDINNGLNQLEVYKDPKHSKSETIRIPLALDLK